MTAKDRPVSKPATDAFRDGHDRIFGGGEEPEDYWVWTGDTLIPLGVCDDFNEACEKDEASNPRNTVWIFSRTCLEELKRQISEELK